MDYPIARSARAHEELKRRAAHNYQRPAKVKVENKTGWSTVDLRKALTRILRSVGATGTWNVRVADRRHCGASGSSGYAYYNSNGFTVRLPKAKDGDLTLHDLEDFACVAVHEMEHSLGLQHHEMLDGGGHSRTTRLCRLSPGAREWIHTLQIRAKPKAPVLSRAERTTALLDKREAKAKLALATWERRLKLARTKVAKYKATVKRYDRRRAASPTPTQETTNG